MKQKLSRLLSGILAFVMVLSLVAVSPLTGITAVRAEDAAAEGYQLTVHASETTAKPGGTVSLTATVTKDGEEITDLKAAGLQLWWWTDVWQSGHEDGLNDASYDNYDNNSGYSLTADVTLPSEGVYYIAAELQDGADTDITEMITLTTENVAGDEFTLYVYQEGAATLYLDIWNHAGVAFAETTETSTDWGWNYPQGVFQPVEGSDNWYSIGLKIIDNTVDDGFDIYADGSSTKIGTYDSAYGNNSDIYATLNSKTSAEYAIKDGVLYTSLEEAKGSVNYGKEDLEKLVAAVPSELTGYTASSVTALNEAVAAANTCLANADATQADYTASCEALAAAIAGLRLSFDLCVEPVAGITEDTIRGMDISSYLSIMNAFDYLNEKAGEKIYGFRDYEGNLLDKQEFFDFLAKQGVNYVRIRIWNDPYDAEGNGYGGGNNDTTAAMEMGMYATNAGMKVLIDFHYSDFWADPSKQQSPKAWEDYSIAERAEAIEAFTRNALEQLLGAGVDVAMVQVGNETNGAMCGVTGTGDWTTDLDILFDAGCDTVHEIAAEYNKTILAAVHFTNPESTGKQAGYAANLAAYDGDGDGIAEGVSYDVFATSYYPYWHGSLTNLTSVLSDIAKTYDKYVMVAETSWANTLDDVDGWANTVRVGVDDTGENHNWLFTVQGQTTEFRDVLASVVGITNADGEERGLGAFYWEGAWIGLQNAYAADGTPDETILSENQTLWEKYGCGWASSYAAGYDPDDAGKWYGGSAVDNQCFFAADGTALASLAAFNYQYLSVGTSTENKIADGYTSDSIEIQVGETLTADQLGTVSIIYNDNSKDSAEVDWNVEDIAAINTKAAKNAGVGSYTVNGTLKEDQSFSVTKTVVVSPKNLLDNASFEEYADSAWTGWECIQTPDGTANNNETDSRTGSGKVHFYHENEFHFTLTQEISVSKAGTYRAYVYAQGSGAAVTLSVSAAGKTYTGDKTSVTGTWMEWVTPTVEGIEITKDMLGEDGSVTLTYTISVEGSAAAWGTLDDAYLYLDKEADAGDEGESATVNAAAPTISKQPVAATYTYNATAKALSVTVAAGDNGVVTYQWYRNTKNNTTGALKLSGATSATYIPSTKSVGTAYYFCIVTNTNAGVNGTKSASTTSSIVKVTVNKASNTIRVKKTSYVKTASAKKRTITLGTKANGAISYTSSNARITVSKSGKVTIPANFVGKATITIKAGNANYKIVSKKITVQVNPKAVALKTVTSKKAKQATVKWKKNAKVTGYIIQYSTKKSFSGKTTKSVTVKGAAKNSKVLTGLKAGKTYYVRICTYKKVSGKKYTSSWSKAKTVKV